MEIIVSTSNNYLHILPIFCHLFNTFWSNEQRVEIVGYKYPEFELPSNFKFNSLGEQRGSKYFSDDLAAYFEKQDRRFIWMMEDSFFSASVKFDKLDICKKISIEDQVGRVALSADSAKQYNIIHGEYNDEAIYKLNDLSEYRLSTQPAIWKKDFLLQYLTKGLDPWQFECQKKILDSWLVVSLNKHSAPIVHNEGVRKWDLYKYDLNGIPDSVINEMKKMAII